MECTANATASIPTTRQITRNGVGYSEPNAVAATTESTHRSAIRRPNEASDLSRRKGTCRRYRFSRPGNGLRAPVVLVNDPGVQTLTGVGAITPTTCSTSVYIARLCDLHKRGRATELCLA